MPTNVISVSDLILDNSIQQDTTNTSNYFADNGIIRADFIQSGNIVKYTSKGRMITWVPQNMRYVDSLGMEDTIYSAQDVPLETKANYVRFNRTMPDIDDWFIVENDQVKHQILVQGFQRDPMPYLSDPIQFAIGGQLVFDADLTVRSMGMTLTGAFQTSDAIQICDGDKVIFTLPQVVAYDSKIPERAQTTGFYNVTTNEAGNLQFDIVIDNAWVSDVARVYPLVIDPTVIVSSAYDTSGNGGRKMARLSSNKIATLAKSGNNLYIYQSSDGGQTWSQAQSINNGTRTFNDVAIATDGTKVFVLANYTNYTVIQMFILDPANSWSFTTNSVDSTQTSIGAGCSLIIDGNGKLWAVLCSKNAAYVNSFNIVVSSSSDGGITWAALTQLTIRTNSSQDSLNPCFVVRSNNLPTIFYTYNTGTSNHVIYANTYNGSSWTEVPIVNVTGGSYTQSNPCGAVDNNDVIFSGWDGADATTSNHRARWSKSTDGGATWSAMALINPSSTNASTNVSFTVRPDNSVDAFWQEIDPAVSATYTQIRRANLPAGSSTWSAPVTITNNTTANATNPQTLWSKFNMNSSDAVRYMWMTGSAIDYDSISLNNPPNAPTLTAHGNFDATVAQTFTATYSDPDSGDTMSARQLQMVDVGTGSAVYDTGKVAQVTSVGNQTFNVVVPANTLTNGKQYQWREMTWDSSGAQGPWSSYSTFYTVVAPTVAITAPTANQVITTSSETVTFSYSDPASNAQQSYEVMLYDATGNTLIEDSGTLNGTNNQYTLHTVFANNTTYVAKVKATNSKGITSAVATQTFSVSYTPPATATIAVTPNSAGAYNTVTVTNPAPSGSQPAVSSNDLYRKPTGSTVAPIRIATGIANNGAHNDYTAPSGVSHDYYVLANGSNGTTSQSATASQTITLTGLWMHDVTDPTGTALNVRINTPRSEQWTPDSTPMKFAGRTRPVVAFSEQEDYRYQVSLKMTTAQAIWPALSSLARRKTILCVRDSRGRKMFAIIAALPETDEFYGESVDIEFMEVSYTEVV